MGIFRVTCECPDTPGGSFTPEPVVQGVMHGHVKNFVPPHVICFLSASSLTGLKPSLLPNEDWFFVAILHWLPASAPWLF